MARAAASRSAFDRAASLLAARPHFRAELVAKLERAGHAAAEIDEALARLARLGALDEAGLIAQEIERLRDRRALGPLRVRAELLRRGADSELVEAALAAGAPSRPAPLAGDGEAAVAGEDEDVELAGARRAAEVWRQRGGREDAALARHLARRGFGTRAVLRVLAERGSQLTEEDLE